jgi:hypothetical protein
MRINNRLTVFLVAALFLAAPVARAQSAPPLATPAPAAPPNAEFLRAADEVLEQMTHILELPAKEPLKKTIRTRAEIRAYVLHEFEQDKEPEKRYADQKTLEKFGLIPRDFNLDGFLVDLLTEQIAGLYDPKTREFFIADWIPPDQQRLVMSHELTHALQDQHFGLDKWADAAKPNDDAELARHSVLEGSAFAAMMDWQFRDEGLSVRSSPDIAPLLKGMMSADLDKKSQMAKAPPFLQDLLLFPYFAGAVFTQQVLKSGTGWADFQKVFANPPASTQQILHPDLYLKGVVRAPVTLPDLARVMPDWKKLDENIGGEFFLQSLLKQFAGASRADELAPAWAGDRYAIFERAKTKQVLVIFRLRLASDGDAARMFGGLSEELENRYDKRAKLFRRPNYFQFETPDGGVFVRCLREECLLVDGTSRETYDAITRAFGWPAAPGTSGKTGQDTMARKPPAPSPAAFAAMR